MRVVEVDLGDRTYPIYIGRGAQGPCGMGAGRRVQLMSCLVARARPVPLAHPAAKGWSVQFLQLQLHTCRNRGEVLRR